jgi:hypothetical protein
MEALLMFLFFVWGLPILVGHVLGQSRGRTGWAWGALLGWLGVLILACMKPIPAHELVANQQAERELWRQRAALKAGEENPSGIWPPPPTR